MISAPADDPLHLDDEPHLCLEWKEAKTPSTPDKPCLGHTMERTWHMLFHCLDKDLPERCNDNIGLCGCNDH